MRKWILMFAALGLLAAGPVWAQCNDGVDEICIIWDYPDPGCQNCTSYMGGPINAYVVLVNPSAAGGVSGFEFLVCNEDGAPLVPPASNFVTGWVLPPGAVNVATAPEFIVGLATPQPWAPLVLMVEMQLLIFAPDCWCFGVSPVATPSIPGEMAYADGADPGNIIPLYPCTGTGWPSCFMACLNCTFCPPGPPVGTEPATFGSVKAIYR
jgi:hypothetical protein